MRIGILIGISEYDNYSNLPGCENDINALSDVLNTSKEFDEIKVFNDRVESSDIKSELSKLFAGWKGNDIEELFFYFSGHGSFINNEFYYILSDFDDTQKRQTSLQNSEIDSMIKSIKPKMVTKVIDACQSGVSYVKGNTNIVEKYYSKTTDNFEKCYFLHSSMTNQYSYQTKDLSKFTESFLKSIRVNNKPSIRYKDIMDYISDEFDKSAEQTPFFVVQADFTENFLNSSTELQNVITKYIKQDKTQAGTKTENIEQEVLKYSSYIDKIKQDAEIYSSQEDVENLLKEIGEVITTANLNTEINELYSYNHLFEHNLRHLTKGILIARWLEENTNDFFAKADYERISYKEEESKTNSIFAGGSIASMLKPNKIITKYRNELKGFVQALDIPYKYITVNFIPNFPNLRQYGLLFTFLISKKEIKIFYAFISYNETDWTRKEVNKNFKWKSEDFLIKNKIEILEFISQTLKNAENDLMIILKEKFDPKA